MNTFRHDGRCMNELRPVRIVPHFLKYAGGSALLEMGHTRVICAASYVDEIPPFLRETGEGWLTAEYAMLPMSTETRSPRGRTTGRTYEIQRIVGRSLRAITDLREIGGRTIYVDCDVIQADGGTRTASITGGFIAVYFLFQRMKEEGLISALPLKDYVAAVSVGLLDGEVLLDLDYSEDSKAEVDLNVVMTGSGKIVEIQGTAEKTPFDEKTLKKMLKMASRGIKALIEVQKSVIGDLS